VSDPAPGRPALARRCIKVGKMIGLNFVLPQSYKRSMIVKRGASRSDFGGKERFPMNEWSRFILAGIVIGAICGITFYAAFSHLPI